MDLTGALWRKSSRSSNNQGNCVEVAAWRKSSRSSNNQGACVEIAPLPGVVAVRDSKNPDGPALTFTHAAWRTFTNTLKNA
jgi:hypothetical protein